MAAYLCICINEFLVSNKCATVDPQSKKPSVGLCLLVEARFKSYEFLPSEKLGSKKEETSLTGAVKIMSRITLFISLERAFIVSMKQE